MLKSVLKKLLGRKQGKHKLRRLFYYVDYLIGGGEIREFVLVKLLEQHYNSKFRRQWLWSEEPPHFFDQRIGFFWFAFGERSPNYGPYSFYRGFFSSEIIREGDQLLDIGCGDGFFTKRFLAARCTNIDALDIDPSAIKAAKSYNSAPNITYYLLDAVNQPFPEESYDVVVWDGDIGHFSADTTNYMLQKILQHLSHDGIFIGSESLGIEGSDHLQFFHSLNDLYVIFRPYFSHIELRCETYNIGGVTRKEAYWRCTNEPKRLQGCHWKEF